MGWKVGDKGAVPEEIKKKIYDNSWGNSEKREQMIASMKAAAIRNKDKHTWHTGKKIDADKFVRGFELWNGGDISKREYAEYVGLCDNGALNLRLNKLKKNGFLPGEHFTDGKPVYYGRVPIGNTTITRPVVRREKFD